MSAMDSDERGQESTAAAAPEDSASQAAQLFGQEREPSPTDDVAHDAAHDVGGERGSAPDDGSADVGSSADVPSGAAEEGATGESPYEATFRSLNAGEIVNGLVVHIDEHGALVDVGQKSEGVIPAAELRAQRADEPAIAVGDRIDVMVVRPEDRDGNILLSKKKADYERVWKRVIEAHEQGKTVSAMVTDRVRGGLVVDLGLRGFLPASQVATRNVAALDRFVGQSVRLKILEVDRVRKRVVVSQRLAVEDERSRKRAQTLESLEENQIRKGTVRRITDYGAFIDLGGVDGLLHITEMSWTRIGHPSEVLKVGQKTEVMVLKFDRENQRISLGLKQILPDPWQQVASHYRTGQIVTGKVTRVVPFGAFIQLAEGIEAIIPNSECGISRSARAQDVLKEGDEIQAKVLSMRPAERRMTLSLRQVQQDQEQREYRDFVRKQRASARVTVGDLVGHQLAAARPAEAEEEEAPSQEAAEPAAEKPSAEAEAPESTAEVEPAPEGAEAPEPTASVEPATAPATEEVAAETPAEGEREQQAEPAETAEASEASEAAESESAAKPEEKTWSSSESPEGSPAESQPSDDSSKPEAP